MFLLAMVFCLIGTFTIHGVLIIHWNDAGVPNNSSGKWVLCCYWHFYLCLRIVAFQKNVLDKIR